MDLYRLGSFIIDYKLWNEAMETGAPGRKLILVIFREVVPPVLALILLYVSQVHVVATIGLQLVDRIH